MRGGRSVSEYFLSSPCGFSSDRTLWKILLPEAHAPVGHLIHHHRNHLPHQTLQTPPRHRPLQTPPQIHLNTPNRIPLPPDILPRNPLLRSPPDHRPHLCHPRNRNPHPQMTAYPLLKKICPMELIIQIHFQVCHGGIYFIFETSRASLSTLFVLTHV